jgi:hypothetical protein
MSRHGPHLVCNGCQHLSCNPYSALRTHTFDCVEAGKTITTGAPDEPDIQTPSWCPLMPERPEVDRLTQELESARADLARLGAVHMAPDVPCTLTAPQMISTIRLAALGVTLTAQRRAADLLEEQWQEISEARIAATRAHIDRCPACEGASDAYRELGELLKPFTNKGNS